jgi:hypothetical protein
MAQTIQHRRLYAKTRVRALASLCEICGEESVHGRGFSPSTYFLLCQYHFTNAPKSPDFSITNQKGKWAQRGNLQT